MRDMSRRTIIRAAALSYLLAQVLSLPLCAQDWPHWMGPHRNGVATTVTTIRTDFSGQLKPAWQVDFCPPGAGSRNGSQTAPNNQRDGGSPVVVDGIVYLFHTRRGKRQTDGIAIYVNHLDAHRLDNGTPVWQVVWEPAEDLSHMVKEVHATPAVANGVIYVVGSDGYIYARATKDGSLVWRSQISIKGGYAGPNGSPLVHDGRLFLLCQRGQIALSCKDGSVLWTTGGTRKDDIINSLSLDSTNNIMTNADGSEILLASVMGPKSLKKGESLVGLDPTTGEVLWHVPRAGARYITPVVAGHYIVTARDAKQESGVYVYDASSVPPSLTFRWPPTTRKEKYTQHNCSALVAHQDRCWWSTFNGVYCFSLSKGEMLWKQEKGVKAFSPNSTPVLCGDVLIGTGEGEWWVMDANNGDVLHVQKSVEKWVPFHSPVLADGRLLFRDRWIGLVCYDLRP